MWNKSASIRDVRDGCQAVDGYYNLFLYINCNCDDFGDAYNAQVWGNLYDDTVVKTLD